ncbi:PREDICTED: glycerol-3-phosphate acyltransferase 4 [Rhagoletis zephyria]|uniref:glycerol-3-phosphate acyltransferase 4 n=1 Tax=Rhagoletis zephyria TaxID=28612 RepID=UPI000811752E|nr:PREDICTED: glycerol-3-phosphate acyltransferase 4 [Rhagoletis zephyria]
MFFTDILEFFCIPFSVFISFLVILSAVNKSVGVRRAYVKLLLKIFEFGRLSIESAATERQTKDGETCNVSVETKANDINRPCSKQTGTSIPTTNGNTLISRDSVLLPTTNESSATDRDDSSKDVVWLTLCTAIVGYIKDGEHKRRMVDQVLGHCFSVLSSAISAVIYYHNVENRPTNGICVANHTSPIDVLVLMCDKTYSLIGQRHGGFLGLLQRALARASPHIWFERGEAKDRHAVAERLKQHVSNPNNPPILIFPEGTCINNTSVMQFKKGSFEVGGVIYPVAIKYDPRFGDAFWNSSKYSMMQYLYMMMTSWAIVCDVWYLPPMYRQEGESAIDFANRVKSVIAKQGGLVDLVWDGQLKRMKPKKEWKEMQQVEFTKRLKGD